MNKARISKIENKLNNFNAYKEIPLFLEVIGDFILFEERLLKQFNVNVDKYELKDDFYRLVPKNENFIKPLPIEEGYNLIYIFDIKQPIYLDS